MLPLNIFAGTNVRESQWFVSILFVLKIRSLSLTSIIAKLRVSTDQAWIGL
jgi:hypothetical protein